MKLTDLLDSGRIATLDDIASKKRALEAMSELLATNSSLSARNAFDSLIGRERIGSTGLGGGVAIPHGRVRGIDAPIGAFALLADGVDFDASDKRPVDLVFALMVPPEATEAHLQILANVAEMFQDDGFCSRLRAASSTDELRELLDGYSA